MGGGSGRRVAGAGHDFSEDAQLWDKIMSGLYSTPRPTPLLGPVADPRNPDEDPLLALKRMVSTQGIS